MNYLAIDTASDEITVALCVGEARYSHTGTEGRKASERVLLIVDELLDQAGVTLKDMDAFACTVGPGSFTGIRIGVTAIKTFAYVFGKKVAAVNSLDRLAYNNTGKTAGVAIAHAYADRYFVKADDGEPLCLSEAELPAYLDGCGGKAVFADKYSAAAVPFASQVDPVASLLAATDALIAEGKLIDYGAVEPFYMLLSQAERDEKKRNEQGERQ